jgi:N-glycosylase/DNA lyase
MAAQVQTPILVQGLRCFDLQETLSCGQSFRWRKCSADEFEGVAQGRVVRVRQCRDALVFEGAPPEDVENFWRGYFDLDTDYEGIYSCLRNEPAFSDALGCAYGIRILRQDPWEALASFILSQNNNIKRIEGLIERLCDTFGDEIVGQVRRAFPTPKRLAGLHAQDLRALGCGYRAEYLIDAAQKVFGGEICLESLRAAPLGTARAALMRIRGVGPKVADCALLFGLHRLECFPVDVWIARARDMWLPNGVPDAVAPFAGLAQQVLFQYIRKHYVPQKKTGEKPGRPDARSGSRLGSR